MQPMVEILRGMLLMLDELNKHQCEEVFNQDFGNLDELDSDYELEKAKKDSYIEGYSDAINAVIKNLDRLEKETEETV